MSIAICKNQTDILYKFYLLITTGVIFLSKKKRTVKTDTIITSHINADFDAIASMLAAQKLYPDSTIIFPGSQEKSLRNFFINSTSYLFNMAGPNSIDFSQTSKLVIVDTRQKNRLTHVSRVLDKKNIEIIIESGYNFWAASIDAMASKSALI